MPISKELHIVVCDRLGVPPGFQCLTNLQKYMFFCKIYLVLLQQSTGQFSNTNTPKKKKGNEGEINTVQV